MQRDFFSGLDPTLFRMYHSRLGRWMTPDPLGGDILNPQSLNRYAYVLNSPTTLTDPLGLQGISDDCAPGSPNINESWCQAQYAYMSNLALESYDLEAAFGLGFSYDYNSQPGGGSFNWYQFPDIWNGNKYYPVPLRTTLDQYANAATNAAALPESQVYAVFVAMCKNQGCDPNQAYQLLYRYKNAVYNVTWKDRTVDRSNLAGYWKDPATLFHDESWYSGFLLDTPHLIQDVDQPMTAHVDPFGPFNPMHYLIQMPSMLLPAGGSGGASCSLNGGCTLGP